MLAGGNLTVDAPVTAAGNITLAAGTLGTGGSLDIEAAVWTTGTTATNGVITMSADAGGINLKGNVGGLILDLSTTGGGTVVQGSGVGIAAAQLQSSNGVTGDVTLNGTNSIAT